MLGDRGDLASYTSVHTRSGEVPADMRGADVNPLRTRLVYLDDMSDLKVAEGDSDIRGWNVRSADGQSIGKVTDHVVDTALMKVRYLEAKLQNTEGSPELDRMVLIPISIARLDEKDDDVVLNTSASDARQLPAYTRGSSIAWGSGSDDTDGETDDGRFFGGRRQGRQPSTHITACAQG